MIIVDPILTTLFSSLLRPFVKYKYSPSMGSNHDSNRQASTIRIPAIVQSNPRFVKPLLILFLPDERKYTAGWNNQNFNEDFSVYRVGVKWNFHRIVGISGREWIALALRPNFRAKDSLPFSFSRDERKIATACVDTARAATALAAACPESVNNNGQSCTEKRMYIHSFSPRSTRTPWQITPRGFIVVLLASCLS